MARPNPDIVIRGPQLQEAGRKLALEVEARYMDLDGRLDRLHKRLDDLQDLVHGLLNAMESVAATEGSERLSGALAHLRRRHRVP